MHPSLLDTDILSELLKGRNPNVVRRASEYLDEYEELTFSSVTVIEILYGFLRKNALAQAGLAKSFLEDHRELCPGEREYRLAAEIMAVLDQRGTPIGPYDPLIAACALNHGLVLVTGNTRHFASVQDAGFPLRLEDWRQP